MGSTQSTKSTKKPTLKRSKNNKVHPWDQTLDPSLVSCDRLKEDKITTKLVWCLSIAERNNMKAALEQQRSETRNMESNHREAEGLKTEIIHVEKDLVSLLTDMGVYSHETEANDLKFSNLKSALRDAKQKLSNVRLCWEKQKKCHFEELEQLRATNEAECNNIKSENQELKATLTKTEENFNICCLENDQLMAAHREAEQQWQEEKDFFMTQLKMYKQLCMSQTDTQRRAHLKYEDDKAEYLQTTADLRHSLRKKEQKWKRRESSMKAQLEQQRSQIKHMEAELTQTHNLKTEILHLQKEITSLMTDINMPTSSHVTEHNNLEI